MRTRDVLPDRQEIVVDIETRRGRKMRIQTAGLALLIVGLHVVFLVCSRPGFLASDDLFYTQIVRKIIDGSFSVQPRQFHNRFGLLFPVALCVRWFGMTPWTWVLWPVLCSCASVLLVFGWTTRRYGRTAGILAGLLIATSRAQVHWALHIMPDTALGALLFAAVLCAESARASTRPASRWGWALAFGAAMFCAICTKLPAIWIAPFLALSLAIDLFSRAPWKPWLALAVTGAISAAAYLGLYWVLTGEPLYRIHAIQDVFATGSLPDFFDYSREAYIRRFTSEPWRAVSLDPTFLMLCIFTLCTLAGIRPRENAGRSVIVRHALYALTFCAAFWFGSISLTHYRPIDPLGRYLLPMIPPMAVCGGVLLATIAANPDTYPSVLRPLRERLRNRPLRLLVAILPVLLQIACLSVAVATGHVGETRDSAVARRFAARYLARTDNPVVVYTNPRSAAALCFYLGVHRRQGLSVKTFSDSPAETTPGTETYACVNRPMLIMLRNLYNISYEEQIRQLLATGSWEPLPTSNTIEIYRRND